MYKEAGTAGPASPDRPDHLPSQKDPIIGAKFDRFCMPGTEMAKKLYYQSHIGAIF